MLKDPTFSIVYLSYRDGADLLRSIKSVLQATQTVDFEIVVIDVMATLTRTERQVLEALDSQFGKRLRVFRSHQNNLAENRNIGLRVARSEWILFLDADTEVEGNAIQILWQRTQSLMQKTPKLAGVGGGNLPPLDESALFNLQRNFQGIFFGHLWSSQMWLSNRDRPVEALSTVFSFFRKDALEKIGLFDTKFSRVCEDLEVGYRLTENGYSLWWVEGPRVIHRSEKNFRGWLSRSLRFGRGQASVLISHPRLLLSPKGPLLLVPFLAPLIFLAPWSALLFSIAVGGYFSLLTAGLAMLALDETKSLRDLLRLLAFSVATHTSYLVGIVWGAYETAFQSLNEVLWKSPKEVTA